MSDKPRHWFQIHLSTAVVLMFVAGTIMWLNTIPGIGWSGGVNIGPTRPGEGYSFLGWPYWNRLLVFTTSSEKLIGDQWIDVGIYYDVLTAIGILAGTAFACELCIRRREARKP